MPDVYRKRWRTTGWMLNKGDGMEYDMRLTKLVWREGFVEEE